ncbi:MAG: hypothetical protein ACK58L_19665 [Planctomycetota bacterium]
MTCQDNELLLNNVLIQMARSFLQYVAECSPWVGGESLSIGEQVNVLAERQRQDVAEIVALLTSREYFIDFGSYPTEYTDQQFLALQTLMTRLGSSQDRIVRTIASAAVSLRSAGDAEGADLLVTLESHERDLHKALAEIASELRSPAIKV